MTTSAAEPAAPARRSPLRRAWSGLALGFVPTVLATHAAGLIGARQGLPERGLALAALVFAGVFAGALVALARVRRRPRLRVALRVLLALHVLFWSARGLLHASLRPAEAPVLSSTVVWQGPAQAFSAGVGEASFRLGTGDTLAGYGARPRRIAFPWFAPGPFAAWSLAMMAEGAATPTGPRVPMFRRGTPGPEPLGARALVVRPADHGPVLAIVRLDLVLCDARVRDAILQQVASLGVVDATLLVCATHTHSGPGGFACAALAQMIGTDHLRPDVFDRVVGAAVEAVRQAHREAVPARLGFVRARDRGPDGLPLLAANRSAPDRDRLDTQVLGIRFDAVEGGRRIALLLNYAVHPVWGRPADTTFSADVAGALERSAAIAAGARTIFVNGAEGDVKPRIGPIGPSGADPLAPFEAAVAKALAGPAPSERLRIAAALVRRDLGTPRAVHALVGPRGPLLRASEGPFGSGVGDAVAATILLPANALMWSAFCDDARLVGTFDGAFGAAASLEPWLDHTRFPVGAVRLETPEGSAVLVAIPGEPTTAVGERIKAEGTLRGAKPVYVLALANDHLAYAGTPEECDAGTYEGRMTLFGPQTSERLFESVEAALDAVGLPMPTGTPGGEPGK